MSENEDYLTDQLNDKFHQLQESGKALAKDGKISNAIELFKEAYKINPTKKVKLRIKKLQAFLEEYGEDINEDMIEVGDNFYLYHELFNNLYPYQRDGVKWLWNLYKKKKGGVLGDDMGLGKTIQIIAFLSGMFDLEEIKHVLIIMPVSLLPNWDREFKKWVPGMNTSNFYSSNKRERERNLIKVQRYGGVLLTSYGTVITNSEILSKREGREFVWDYVILDEGHRIKNPTKTTKAVHDIPARNRIVLTGTPIQNNLKELWALYNFVQQGTLLGSLQTFKSQYEIPITRSREKDATPGERRLGERIAASLRTLIEPYFLRRTKEQVLSERRYENRLSNDHSDDLKKVFCLSRKNDFIIWLFLSEKQLQIYKDFLELDRVKNILMTKRSPLVELTVLKKICDHPRLLSKKACYQLGLDDDINMQDIDDDKEYNDEQASTFSIENVSDEILLEESGKLEFLLALLQNLKETNHRTLIFSQSRKMLDIVHRILLNRNWKIMRIDGTITKIEERQRRIQCFQKDLTIPVFLLTTQVGGVGLTLTGADRVIIYDPSWNPATDAQAVDRVYRIGQDKSVVVYRLITCSTVEEKIYRRQIFKDSINRQTTGGNKDPHRYFTKQELRELFILENPYHSTTQMQLEQMHASQRVTDVDLDSHVAFLHSLKIFGISDHDLMFSGNFSDKRDEGQIPEDYIQQRVEKAQMMLQIESAQTMEDIETNKIFARPFNVPLNSRKTNSIDNNKIQSFPEPLNMVEFNTSLENMSIQEKSIDIMDASTASATVSKTNNLLDIMINEPNYKNSFEIENTETIDKLGIQTEKSLRKSIYVPDSDNSKSISPRCDLSTELFIPESDGDDDDLVCTHIEYRNKSLDSSELDPLREVQHRRDANSDRLQSVPEVTRKNRSADRSQVSSKAHSTVYISSDSEDGDNARSIDRSTNFATSQHNFVIIEDDCHMDKHNALTQIGSENLSVVPNRNLCQSSVDLKSLAKFVEDETMEFSRDNSEISIVDKENRLLTDKNGTETMLSFVKRITPLRVSKSSDYGANSPFQKALKASMERYPATSSPLGSAGKSIKPVPMLLDDKSYDKITDVSVISSEDEESTEDLSAMDKYESSSEESAIISACKKKKIIISDSE